MRKALKGECGSKTEEMWCGGAVSRGERWIPIYSFPNRARIEATSKCLPTARSSLNPSTHPPYRHNANAERDTPGLEGAETRIHKPETRTTFSQPRGTTYSRRTAQPPSPKRSSTRRGAPKAGVARTFHRPSNAAIGRRAILWPCKARLKFLIGDCETALQLGSLFRKGRSHGQQTGSVR